MIRGISLALLLLPALGACGRKDHEVARGSFDDGAAERGSYSVTHSDNGRSVVIRTDKGIATIQSGADAARMPAGLILYPGATLTSSTAIRNDNGNDGRSSAVLSFASADPPGKIAEFYKTTALRAGYRIENEMVMGGTAALLTATNPNGAGFTLSISPRGAGSEATLIASGSGSGAEGSGRKE